MKLGIELTSGMGSQDVRSVRRIAEAALRQGHQVSLFLMDDGVYHMQALRDLAEQGVQIAVCAHNAYQRGLGKVEGVLFGGQNDWAEIVHDADRVIVFG